MRFLGILFLFNLVWIAAIYLNTIELFYRQLSRNRMNVDQQWRLLELVAANVDILITDTDPETDEQHREARTEFWKIATKVLNQLGESAGKYKDIGGWRKVNIVFHSATTEI